MLVEALRTRHRVCVIAPIPWHQHLNAPHVHNSDADTFHPIYVFPPKILRRYYHHFYWQSVRCCLQRLEREFKPQVVLGYWLHPDGAVAVRAAERLSVPALVMSGGSDLRLLTKHRSRQAAIRRVITSADKLIVFSRELAAQAQRLGVPADKLDVIYRGVNRQCFYPRDRAQSRDACGLSQKAIVLLWVGRMESVKNPWLLLRAAAHWRRHWGNRLRVILAGGGPLQPELESLSRQLQLDDTVKFVGSLTHSELALWYNAADLTVLTSFSEGVPNSLLESIACGTPFVATDVGGIAEIASPVHDRLVPSDNVQALASAVVERMQSSSAEEREFIPADVAEMAEQFESAIASVLSTSDL